METSPRPQISSYLERWEEQKAQSRRNRRRQQRQSSDVGDELSFISAIERDAGVQHEGGSYDSFDLPPMDAFPPSELTEPMREQRKTSMDDEFVDAATFLRKTELGGDDSFSHDIEENWEHGNSSGRPSDFFERKSRNLDCVELSSPRNGGNSMFHDDRSKDAVEESGMRTSRDQLSPTDVGQGMALHDQLESNSGLSGSDTALSSGYEVHFDNARLMYTPNSLKYLQEKSRMRSKKRDVKSEHIFADHAAEAEVMIRKTESLPDQEIPDDSSPEFVATLQRGPRVIKEALQEIDALIDNSFRSASSSPRKNSLGVELSDDMREFVRDFERPLESMLPLSRTTDSWGEDTSVSQLDEDVRRRSRDLESLSSGIEPVGQIKNSVRRSRSQENPELDTIREVPCPSNTDSASQSQQSSDVCDVFQRTLYPRAQRHLDSYSDEVQGQRSDKFQKKDADVDHFSNKRSSSEKIQRWDDPKPRTTSTARDRSVPAVGAIQSSFHDEMYSDRISCGSDEEHSDAMSCYPRNDVGSERKLYSEERLNGGTGLNHFERSHSDDVDPNSARLGCRGKDQQSMNVTHTDDQRHGTESRTTATLKQPGTSGRCIDVPESKKLHVAMDAAMIPRRCRRFLCSVGDVMTEQIVFTNGTKSVGRICVSLLPLSTGCQQFSVSPAVLELGPKASCAFHVTFNARYAGAVAGIFQFRGVGIESLFHPYEVVIEASVKRNLELVQSHTRRAQKRTEADSTNDRIQELQGSSSVDQVAVTPTFLRFDCVQSKTCEKLFRTAKLRLVNNTAQTLSFKVRPPENLGVNPASGMIQPASEVNVSVLPMSQPLRQHRDGELSSVSSSFRAEDWVGTLTVRIGKTYVREVVVKVDWRALETLPPFDEIARSRHQLSSQTDSFYYTKRQKRRGLYFHARAVEFGCCNVGEVHEVPVYVCNGSKAPMTVFLQDLQEPFSCDFSSTTIEPRKFIEVMVTFTPKVVGKVATSLFAYSVTDKAVVTLVARGT